MTLVEDRPAGTQQADTSGRTVRSGVPGWRLASRLARREVRRRPGRTVLVMLLIAVPVAAMTVGAVLARTNAHDWEAEFEQDYGDADLVVGADLAVASAPGGSDAVLPEGSSVTEYVSTSTSIMDADGRLAWVTLRTADDATVESGDDWSVGIEVLDGRVPVVGEVLIGDETADAFGVTIGDELVLDRPSGAWTVVGIGRRASNYWEEMFVLPGLGSERFVAGTASTTQLVDLPPGTSDEDTRSLATELGAVTRFRDPFVMAGNLAEGMAWGYVAGLLALVATGIIVTAAFATSARRQLVTIGQLAANGSPGRVVRGSLALQGTWSGAVGALVGVAAGAALVPIARPLVERHLVYRTLPPTVVVPSDLLVVALTAVVVATIAAAVPARSAANVPVMAALAGRRPVGTPPRWLVPTGLALLLGGLGTVALAAFGAKVSGPSNGEAIWVLLAVLGGTALAFGACCAAPLAVECAGRLGRRASLSWRLGLRSLARARGRSAAVVASIAVTVGAAVALAAVVEAALATSAACCPAQLPADTVVVDVTPAELLSPPMPDDSDMVDYDAVGDVDLPTDVIAEVESIMPGATVEPILVATYDPVPYDERTGQWHSPYGPYIATPALVELVGLSGDDQELLATSGVIVPWYGEDARGAGERDGVEWLEYRAEDGTIVLEPTVARRPLTYEWRAQPMMTDQAARDAGFEVARIGVIIRGDASLDDAQLDALGDLRDRMHGTPLDSFVEPGDPPRTLEMMQTGMLDSEFTQIEFDDPRWYDDRDDDLWLSRLAVVAAAVVLGLIVVSIGLALAAAEGRSERDVMIVVGAPSASLRRQAAARAVVLAAVGIVIGVPLGFGPAWVVGQIQHDPANRYGMQEIGFPWLVVGTLAVAIPLLVALGAWMASGVAQRFRPASPARRD